MRHIAMLAFHLLSIIQAAPWDSVVRIEVAGVAPSYLRPWEKSAQRRSSGSGFVVDGSMILTNHHVIEKAVDIRLSKTGHSRRWRAKLVAVAPDIDLAALEVVDPDAAEFFKDLAVVTWSETLPALQSRVTVRGYPMGGTAQSVTEGVVSRVEAKNYRLGTTASVSPGSMLVMQIDAAINGGNSGGPCFDSSDRVVGVAFQGINGAQSIGYIIPASIARNFLAAAADTPKYKVVDVPFRTQPLENRGLRKYLKVPDNASGVVVSAVSPLSALAPPKNASANASSATAPWLLPDDVITSIDGVSVGDDGSVPLRPGERVSLDWLITSKVAGALTELSILRDGRPMVLHAPLAPLVPPLPRWDDFDCRPEWVVIGGLVFSPLTAPLIEDASLGGNLNAYVHDVFQSEVAAKKGFNTDPDREVVLMLDVLNGGDVNHGYDAMDDGWKVLSTFNGQPVRSLAGLYSAWKQAAADGAAFLDFGFGKGVGASHIVLEQTAVAESEELLLATHGIPSSASKGVMEQARTSAVRDELAQAQHSHLVIHPKAAPKPPRGPTPTHD